MEITDVSGVVPFDGVIVLVLSSEVTSEWCEAELGNSVDESCVSLLGAADSLYNSDS